MDEITVMGFAIFLSGVFAAAGGNPTAIMVIGIIAMLPEAAQTSAGRP